MRAVTIDAAGRRPKLRDVAVPAIADGDVLLDVRTSAVSGIDQAVIDGLLLESVDHRFPVTLGRSVAGVVARVGAGVTELAPGDRAFGLLAGGTIQRGTWSDQVVLPAERLLAPIPDGLGFDEAGALGLAGVVAMNLVAAVRARDGLSVLVSDGASAVGTLALQLAALRGARVTAGGAAGDDQLLRALGASDVVDGSADLVAAVRAAHPEGVDAFIDLADRDQADFKATLGVLREGGRAASASGVATGSDRPDVAVSNVLLEPAPDQLRELAALVADGRLRVPIADAFPLDRIDDALAAFRSGPRGAIVVRVADAA